MGLSSETSNHIHVVTHRFFPRLGTTMMVDSTTNLLRDAAVDYAARGWNVHPTRANDKRPLLDDWPNVATTDVDTIRGWWAQHPAANVAIATGASSGLVVVDIDGIAGENTLERLVAEHGRLPNTLTALTGGDGMHLIYAHPGDGELRNTAGRLGPGIDTRGDGGYIVAPPSLHPSGLRYEWLDPDVEVAPLPRWMAQLLAAPAPTSSNGAGQRAPAPAPGTTTNYARAALEGRATDVAHAPKGQRNHSLNDAAFRMGRLVAGGQIDEQTVVDTLTDAAQRAGLSGTEIAATIRSGLTGGARDPQWPDPARATAVSSSARAGSDLRSNEVVDERAPGVDEEPPPPEPPVLEGHDDDDDPDGQINDTDLGNARRLIRNYGAELRYARHRAGWLCWDGRRWSYDESGHVERCAHTTAQTILSEAAALSEREDQKRRVAWSFKSEMQRQLEAMVRRAQHLRGVSVQAAELDGDPWRLSVLNGTVDLRTGELNPHDPDDLITKLAPVVYDPAAVDRRWGDYLDSALGGDADLCDWLARAVGYTLTGDTSEEVLFFVHGPTSAGKSTFLEAIKATFGDYARNADFETFLDHDHGTGPRGDIARLAGARLVTSNELDEGRRLAEGLVKTLTGGDTITARFLYRDEFEYRPAFKLWLAANHKPKVRHGDDAIWRRIRLVPFTHPPTRIDPTLKKYLAHDPNARAAILAWAINGCLAWQQHGLRAVDAVRTATEAYRAEMDPLGEFFTDHCNFGPPDTHWVTAADLRTAYETWASEQGIRRTLSPNQFREALEDRNCDNERRRIDGKQKRVWVGIRLLADFEDPEQLPGIGVSPVTDDEKCDARDEQDGGSQKSPYARAHTGKELEPPSRATRASHPGETSETPPPENSSGSSPVELLVSELGATPARTCVRCGRLVEVSPSVGESTEIVCAVCSRREFDEEPF